MYSKVNHDEVETYDLDGIEPTLLAIGVELRPDETRTSVWDYEAGESNNRHYQEQQEELYVPLSGRFEMDVEGETVAMVPGDYVVVEPDATRQVTAVEAGKLLVVGAPPVKDDGVDVEE